MSSQPTSQPAKAAGNEAQAPVKEGDVLAAKYRVEKVLGVGGMGVVVAAEHIELSQKVALKFLLKQAASNEDLVGRFLREARASVRLKGTHVAKTLDVGRLEDGCPYIVMEFLDGHDLHSEIRSKSEHLPIEVACSYVVQACEGLAEAHALGIVHRDLKPGNLFLTRGVDGRPLVKVLDFGISKTMDTSIGGDGLSLTKTEMLLGSPLYMSPEQMRSSKHVDERSDLWALGAIAYELLTRRVPFEADSILELCFKVAQEKAPNPQLLRPELPDALAAAVLRCLEKDPAERFANVGELAQAFEAFALARDRGSAERALDVLNTGKRPVQRSMNAPAVASAVTVGLPTPRGGGAVLVGSDSGSGPALSESSGSGSGLSPSEPTPAPGVPAATPSQAEQVAPAAWGTTQAQPPPGKAARSRKGLVAIAAGVIAVAAIGGVAMSRSKVDSPVVGVASAGMVATPANTNAPSTNAPVASTTGTTPATTGASTATSSATPEVDAGARSTAGSAPAAPATAKPVLRPIVKTVKSAPTGTAAPTATATATATAEPGGFIKVRE